MWSNDLYLILLPAQLFFVQSKWYQMNYIIMGLSIGCYFATVSFITSFKFLDFDFYQVRALAAVSVFLSIAGEKYRRCCTPY
jgi:hypothetical protein